MADVSRLLEIHTELTGTERGRRARVEVLHKSAVVLITAAWEAFVEDLAEEAFDFLLAQARTHSSIPNKVQALAAKTLHEGKNPNDLWKLADDGWRNILSQHRDASIKRYAGRLNTPNSENVDSLFEALVGEKSVSSYWYWPRQSADSSRTKLSSYIAVRGQIAHRLETGKNVNKPYVVGYANFIFRLAVKTANRIRNYLNDELGAWAWDGVDYEQLVR